MCGVVYSLVLLYAICRVVPRCAALLCCCVTNAFIVCQIRASSVCIYVCSVCMFCLLACMGSFLGVVLCCCDWCVVLRCVLLCSVVRDVVYCERRAALWSVVLCCAVFSPS